MKTYNKKDQLGKKKNIQFEAKKSVRKFNVGAKTCAERAKKIKETPVPEM